MSPLLPPRRVLGLVLLALLTAGPFALVLQERVLARLERVGGTLAADWLPGSRPHLHLAFGGGGDVRPGHPVYDPDHTPPGEPIAYATGVEGGLLGIRFAPGVDRTGPWRLEVLGAPGDLGETWALAVPAATAQELERRLLSRVDRLLRESVLPAARERLPALLARVDPRQDARAREVLDLVGREIVARLRPLAADLADRVVSDVRRRLDLLQKLGLLWQLAWGDEKGLARKLAPAAQESAEAWWAAHQDSVLAAVGEAVSARSEDLGAWLLSDVLPAVREEVLDPLRREQADRLEREADQAIGEVLDLVVAAPEGGFRLRFAAVLRARLLGKEEPLVYLVRDR